MGRRGHAAGPDDRFDQNSPFALQVEGGVLVEFGASYEDSTSTVTSTGAQYHSEDLWKEWVECS